MPFTKRADGTFTTTEEAIARRLIHEFREAHQAREASSSVRTKWAISTDGRLAGACEIAAIALGASTPFAVHLDLMEAVQSHPACLGYVATQARTTAAREAIDGAVASLVAKWAS